MFVLMSHIFVVCRKVDGSYPVFQLGQVKENRFNESTKAIFSREVPGVVETLSFSTLFYTPSASQDIPDNVIRCFLDFRENIIQRLFCL